MKTSIEKIIEIDNKYSDGMQEECDYLVDRFIDTTGDMDSQLATISIIIGFRLAEKHFENLMKEYYETLSEEWNEDLKCGEPEKIKASQFINGFNKWLEENQKE